MPPRISLVTRICRLSEFMECIHVQSGLAFSERFPFALHVSMAFVSATKLVYNQKSNGSSLPPFNICYYRNFYDLIRCPVLRLDSLVTYI